MRVKRSAYMYAETGEKASGVLVVANTIGSTIFGGNTTVQRRAAEFLGISATTTISVVVETRLDCAPGVKLLENREDGAYLWQREAGDDRVDVHTRIPGWRFKLEHPGRVVPRGRGDASARRGVTGWDFLGGHTPFILVAQVLFPGADASGRIVVREMRDSRMFGVACWAPSESYAEYEGLFEKVLSGIRIYAPDEV